MLVGSAVGGARVSVGEMAIYLVMISSIFSHSQIMFQFNGGARSEPSAAIGCYAKVAGADCSGAQCTSYPFVPLLRLRLHFRQPEFDDPLNQI